MSNFFIIERTAFKESDPKLYLQPEIIAKFEESLGLQYIHEAEAGGNLCFANTRGLRPEFRQTFSTADVIHYIYAIRPCEDKATVQIPYPEDAETFWPLVNAGAALKS